MSRKILWVSGKFFQVITIPHKFPTNILKKKRIKIGFDPKLHTQEALKKIFNNSWSILLFWFNT